MSFTNIKIKIRIGAFKDVNEVFKIGEQTKELRFSRKMHFHEKREIKTWIKDKKSILLVAESNKQVIGFLYAILIDKDWCMLDNVSVKKEFRNNGVGTLLIETFNRQMKKMKVTYISALVDRNYKEPHDFWKKQGFQEGTTYIWYGKDIK